jgi:hypothetical protein
MSRCFVTSQWGRWIERKQAPFEGYWKTLYA